MSEQIFIASTALTNYLIKKGLQKRFVIDNLRTLNIDVLTSVNSKSQFIIDKFKRSIKILDNSGNTVAYKKFLIKEDVDNYIYGES